MRAGGEARPVGVLPVRLPTRSSHTRLNSAHHVHRACEEADRQGPGDCPNAEDIVKHLRQVPRTTQTDDKYVDQLTEAHVRVFTNLDQLEGMTGDEVLERVRTLGL